MKMKRFLLFMCSVAVLTGCQSSSQVDDKKGYDGMNGMETYVAAVQFFNNNVTYYQSRLDDEITVETYKVNNQCSVVTKALYQEGYFSTLNYTITSGQEFHTLFLGEDGYQYEYMNDYSQEVTQMYRDLSIDNNSEILDVVREDKDGQIILTLKLKQSVKYQESDEENSINYIVHELTINSDGYIVKDVETYYEDELFEKVLQDGSVMENTQFNQKTSDDFNDEVELMKSCDGLSDEEVKDKLGL